MYDLWRSIYDLWRKNRKTICLVAFGGAIGLILQGTTSPEVFRYIWGGSAAMALLYLGYKLFIKKGRWGW